jgi:hypothetical protein
MDAELEADRAWQELVVVTHRVHLELRSAVATGCVDLGAAGALRALLAEADTALDAWKQVAERCED